MRLYPQKNNPTTRRTSTRNNLLWGSIYPSLISSSSSYTSYKSLQPYFIQTLSGVLMECSVMDKLFQLDLFLLEVLFVYIVNMSQKERFSLATHIPSLQLVIELPDSGKGGAKGHVLISSPLSGLSEGSNRGFTPQRSLEISSMICLCNFCSFFIIISSSL